MTETKSSLQEVSKKFSSRYLLEWVLFETNQEESKRLAPRVRSIAERISKLHMEYLNAKLEKRREVNKFVIENFLTTQWANQVNLSTAIINSDKAALLDQETIRILEHNKEVQTLGTTFVGLTLAYLSTMTQADYIPGLELTANPIPHTVVCPSESGIAFLNIVNKKLKD
jgi:hypothetical protein